MKVDFDNDLTYDERNALSWIAIGREEDLKEEAVKGLLDKKVICCIPENQIIGSILIRTEHYYLPIDIHLQWAEWCSKRYRHRRNEDYEF